ncbi:MAG: hypothetical protein AB7F96_02210 [Beijerinckiaceae bacterium]
MNERACPFPLLPGDALEKRIAALPDRVAAMREKILEAAESRDLNKLRAAIERNEVMPLFGKRGKRPKRFADAIDFLKARSFDGEGGEVFDLLTAILNADYVLQKRKPVDIFVWPAEAADDTLAQAQSVAQLYRFVSFADVAQTTKAGLPRMHRIEIGADGTWHFFAVE